MSDKVDIPESYLNDTAEMLFKKRWSNKKV